MNQARMAGRQLDAKVVKAFGEALPTVISQSGGQANWN